MGNAYFGLGLWQIAEQLHERALAARETGLGPDDPEVARSLRALQDMRIRGGMSEDDPEILALAQRSYEIGVENRDVDPEGWVVGVTNLTGVYAVTNRTEEGRDLVRASLTEARAVFGPLSPHTVQLRDWSAKYEANVGNYAAAIPIFEDMLGDQEVVEVLGREGVEAMTANLGFMYGNEGMTEKQVELYEEALALGVAEYGTGARRLGDTYWNLAMAYSEAERHDDAARIWETYLAAEEAVYGDDASHTVRLRTNMGFALSDAGRYDEAEAAFAASMADILPLLGDARRGEAITAPYFDTLFGYAILLARTGRAEEVWNRLLPTASGAVDRIEALWAIAAGLEEGGARPAAIAVHDRRADQALERAIASGEGEAGELRGAFIQSALIRVRALDGEGLIALGSRWTGAMERLPGSPPGPVLQSHHDLSYHLFLGEHREGIEPIPETRPRALEPVLRALAFQEGTEGQDSPLLLRQLAPLRLIREYRGEGDEAAAAIERARTLARARVAELERQADRGEEVAVGSWNFVCWWGSLAGAAEEALPACERGVAGAPDGARGGILDSRAVAYAQTGRMADAARDFRSALEAGTYSTWQIREQRTRWAEALEQGENPLDLEALATLAF
jgi:tetratricopeptide (TPR) repeat protein